MQTVSSGDNMHAVSNPNFWENVKSHFLGKVRKILSIYLSSAQFAQSTVWIKPPFQGIYHIYPKYSDTLTL